MSYQADQLVNSLEFVVGCDGDLSAGLHDWRDDVIISFRHGFYVDEDDVEFLRKSLAEWADGWCVTKEEYDKKIKAEKDSYKGHHDCKK